MSQLPHPEFANDYTLALAELRRGKAPDEMVEAAIASLVMSSDSAEAALWLRDFFKR